MTEVVHTTLGEREFFFIKEQGIIYSLFVSKELDGKQDFDNLLLTLVDVIKSDFPADIEGGIVEAKGHPKDLEKKIEATIEQFMIEEPYDVMRGVEQTFPLSDVSQILGKDNFVQVFRGLLAGKKVVVLGYDPSLILKVIHSITPFWPEHLKVVLGTELDKIKEEEKTFFVTVRWREDEVRGKVENATYIDLDSSFKKKFEEDLLFEKLDEILALESEESRKSMLKSEIVTLKIIVNDVKELLAEAEGGLRLKTLRKKLSNKHPKEKVKYVLDVLINEESPMVENIRTPFFHLF
ncbi:MAG: hypothetical protein GWN17_06760 [Candidatus Korarchaeota archaeon]|nr:hypothetical protein [Candidatus Korarchaeota archaeon]